MNNSFEQPISKFFYSLPAFINGIIAIILGLVGRTISGNFHINGAGRFFDIEYDQAVRRLNNVDSGLTFLVILGAILVLAGVILIFVKPSKKIPVLHKLLWVAPLIAIVVISVINYIPIIDFHLNWAIS